MSKAVPYANSTAAGTGQTWFKVFEMPPVVQNGQLTFPSESKSILGRALVTTLIVLTDLSQFSFNLPKSLPSGQYLIRVEHVRAMTHEDISIVLIVHYTDRAARC